MKALLDTHFLLWMVLEAKPLARYAWIDRYRPWGVSPVSLLEIQFLSEAGRLEVRGPELLEALLDDARFVIDEISLLTLIRQSLPLQWTRDPFDRLLAAHSAARRVPLCTVDENILRHHRFLPKELSH